MADVLTEEHKFKNLILAKFLHLMLELQRERWNYDITDEQAIKIVAEVYKHQADTVQKAMENTNNDRA